MDQSSFHCSWLALGALCKGCFPSCFPQICHALSFSVSPKALAFALVSRKHSKFISIRLVRRVIQTNGASGSALTSSTIWIRFWVFRPVRKHMLMQNWQKLHFTGPPLKASLPLEALCIFFWWGYCVLLCQFWDGEGLCTCTPPSWNTKLWCTQNEAEISRLKIKFGDLPRWVRSCWKQKPTQSWKFPLLSWEPSDLVNLVSQAN